MTNAKTAPKVAEVAPVQQVENVIDDLANDPATAALLTEAAAKIPAKARRGIYIGGIVLGGVVTVAAAVGAALTGNVAEAVGSLGGLAYSLSNLLAVLHLNVDPAASK